MPTSKSSIDHRDVYYRKGKSAGYRARSAYKLLHLDEEFDLFLGVDTAVDLCAAPGSWTQCLSQRLKPVKEGNGKKVVSVDLQAMAPLPNVTILQTDITLPSTIPLVLDALGGRKADLVVCDGAPDVTGVHDLDAYLHSQLLLAALTLSLTLLAPHATLIFKIFLSPLDPKAEFLASQLRCFFPGPKPLEGNVPYFGEFDEENGNEDEDETMRKRNHAGSSKGEGFDLQGRRGGVWVRKPRSSRKGSGEAFIVCRNFSPSSLPLPTEYSPSALDALRTQAGALTLESLSTLGSGGKDNTSAGKEWEMIKGYVGGGDLSAMDTGSSSNIRHALLPKLSLPLPSSHFAPPTATSPPISESASPKALQPQPTPLDGPPEYFSPISLHFPSTSYLSPTKPTTPSNKRFDSGEAGGSGQNSLDSLSPNPSPVQLTNLTKPWVASSHTVPPPRLSPPSTRPSSIPESATLGVPNRWRSTSNASSIGEHSASGSGGMLSPSLSTSSKTDLFFASGSGTFDLPTPPRALPNASALGRGLPGGIEGGRDRSITLPAIVPMTLMMPPRKEKFRDNLAVGAWRDKTTGLGGFGGESSGVEGLEETSTSRLRSISNPGPPVPPLPSHLFLNTNPSVPAPLSHSSAFREPSPSDITPRGEPHKRLRRKDSQILEREQRQTAEDFSLHAGDIVAPSAVQGNEQDGGEKQRGWKLVKKLGEGAFSAVWSAQPASHWGSEEPKTKVAALKLINRHLSLLDSRTRISFFREIEVLRHISHAGIVRYIDSFSTGMEDGKGGHDVLVLEELAGGELFGLVCNEDNRQRMILPAPKPETEGQEWDRDGEGFIRRVFGELAKAVGWLHEVGVVHRDIKLENILFTTNPFLLSPTSTGSIPLHELPPITEPLIKLTDFGLSRFIPSESPLLQTRCGSESFAAPEIIMGKPYDGRQTDAWALGVVLYGLAIGELPFDREDEDGLTTPGRVLSERERGRKRMMKIAKGEYSFPTPPTLSPTIPGGYVPGTASPNLRSLIASLLERVPEKRAMPSPDMWDHPWMSGPGGVERPNEAHGSDVGDDLKGRGTRRVLDGFLVEGDKIEDVAMAEH